VLLMYKHLTVEQRYQIEALRKQSISLTAIAATIGVHKSTISRELKRNSLQKLHPPDCYRALSAQKFSQKRAYKPLSYKTSNPSIQRRICWLLKQGWSPEQIAHTCRHRAIPMISTEAIYLWIYHNRYLHKELDLTLLLRRRHRKRRKRALQKQPRVVIKNKTSIHQRPNENNTQIGHYEIDTAKCQNGYLLVLTERQSLFNIIIKMPNKSATSVANALMNIKEQYAFLSLTSDNGTEFAQHQSIAQQLKTQWFFADANRPDQRGKNENQIGLIRQYLNRKTDLNNICQKHIDNLQQKLNHRPRKKHNFISPIKFLLVNSVALVC